MADAFVNFNKWCTLITFDKCIPPCIIRELKGTTKPPPLNWNMWQNSAVLHHIVGYITEWQQKHTLLITLRPTSLGHMQQFFSNKYSRFATVRVIEEHAPQSGYAGIHISHAKKRLAHNSTLKSNEHWLKKRWPVYRRQNSTKQLLIKYADDTKYSVMVKNALSHQRSRWLKLDKEVIHNEHMYNISH